MLTLAPRATSWAPGSSRSTFPRSLCRWPANFSCIGVSAPDKAPHPNAAQLYAHFVSSPAAAQAFEDALPSVISPFGDTGIPETITPLPTESDNEHLLALLGR